jgi:hypothetical protein
MPPNVRRSMRRSRRWKSSSKGWRRTIPMNSHTALLVMDVQVGVVERFGEWVLVFVHPAVGRHRHAAAVVGIPRGRFRVSFGSIRARPFATGGMLGAALGFVFRALPSSLRSSTASRWKTRMARSTALSVRLTPSVSCTCSMDYLADRRFGSADSLMLPSLLARSVFLACTRGKFGEGGGTRTLDQRIKSQNTGGLEGSSAEVRGVRPLRVSRPHATSGGPTRGPPVR